MISLEINLFNKNTSGYTIGGLEEPNTSCVMTMRTRCFRDVQKKGSIRRRCAFHPCHYLSMATVFKALMIARPSRQKPQYVFRSAELLAKVRSCQQLPQVTKVIVVLPLPNMSFTPMHRPCLTSKQLFRALVADIKGLISDLARKSAMPLHLPGDTHPFIVLLVTMAKGEVYLPQVSFSLAPISLLISLSKAWNQT